MKNNSFVANAKNTVMQIIRTFCRNLMILFVVLASGGVSMLINYAFFGTLGSGEVITVFGFPITGTQRSAWMGITFDVAKIISPFMISFLFIRRNYLTSFIWLVVFIGCVDASLNSTKASLDNDANNAKNQSIEYDLANKKIERLDEKLDRLNKEHIPLDESISSSQTQIENKVDANGKKLAQWNINRLLEDIQNNRDRKSELNSEINKTEVELDIAISELKKIPKVENEFTNNHDDLGWRFSRLLEMICFASSFTLGVRSREHAKRFNIRNLNPFRNDFIEGEATEIKNNVALPNNIEIDSLVNKKVQAALSSISSHQNSVDAITIRDELLLEISKLKSIVEMSAEQKIQKNIFVPSSHQNDKNIENEMSSKNVCLPLSQGLTDTLTDKKNDSTQTKKTALNQDKKQEQTDVLQAVKNVTTEQKGQVKVVDKVVVIKDKQRATEKKKYNKQSSINNFEPWSKEEIKQGVLDDVFSKYTLRSVAKETYTCKNTVQSVFQELCETGDMRQQENNRYIRIYKDKSISIKPILSVSNSSKLVKFDDHKMQSGNDEIYTELEEC